MFFSWRRAKRRKKNINFQPVSCYRVEKQMFFLFWFCKSRANFSDFRKSSSAVALKKHGVQQLVLAKASQSFLILKFLSAVSYFFADSATNHLTLYDFKFHFVVVTLRRSLVRTRYMVWDQWGLSALSSRDPHQGLLFARWFSRNQRAPRARE